MSDKFPIAGQDVFEKESRHQVNEQDVLRKEGGHKNFTPEEAATLVAQHDNILEYERWKREVYDIMYDPPGEIDKEKWRDSINALRVYFMGDEDAFVNAISDVHGIIFFYEDGMELDKILDEIGLYNKENNYVVGVSSLFSDYSQELANEILSLYRKNKK